MRGWLRRASRGWQVFGVLLRWFVLPALPFRRRRPQPGAERTRAALEELGGAWVKLGQMLSMRFDLLPAACCEELLNAQRCRRLYEQVREIVQQELGRRADVLFASFASAPFLRLQSGRCIAPRCAAASMWR